MPLLLARLARSIANHWKRSALIATAVVVLLGIVQGLDRELTTEEREKVVA